MGIKGFGRKIAIGIAATGLSSCGVGGGDPVPPPIECTSENMGQNLSAVGAASGNTITITFTRQNAFGNWSMATVTDVVGAAVQSVKGLPPVNGQVIAVQVTLTLPTTDGGMPDGGSAKPSGSFVLHGTITGGNQSCNFQRAFHFIDLGQGQVQVSEALPLRARQDARIALVRRDGDELHLEARSHYPGERAVEWRVSDGEMVHRAGERLVWRLPDAPGLYQVELVMDYGDAGLAVDTMTFEIT